MGFLGTSGIHTYFERFVVCLIVNIFLQHQTTAKPFERLIIVGPSNGAPEYAEMEPTAVLTDIPSLDNFDKKIKTLLIFDDWDAKYKTNSRTKT